MKIDEGNAYTKNVGGGFNTVSRKPSKKKSLKAQ